MNIICQMITRLREVNRMKIQRNESGKFTVTNIDHVADKYVFHCQFCKYGSLITAQYTPKGSGLDFNEVPTNWTKILTSLSSIGSAYSV